MMTTADLVRRNASEHAQTPFLIFYDETVTYAELDRRTDAVAAYLLKSGVGKGDIVSFMMGNSPEFFYVFLGAQKTGAIAGPISCWWQAGEVKFLVNHSRSAVLVVDEVYLPLVAAIEDDIASVRRIVVNSSARTEISSGRTGSDIGSQGPGGAALVRPTERLAEILASHDGHQPAAIAIGGGDIASVMYTSGTTGTPRGVLLTHKGLVEGARMKTAIAPLEPADRTLCVLPLFHSGGLSDLALPSMYRALTIVLRRNFSATEFWHCVEHYRVNAFYIVPTMWNILLKAPESHDVDTSSLRFGLSGAAPIPPEQLEECRRRFNVPILEAYGATENSGGITANTMERAKHGSVGFAFEGLDLAVVDGRGTELQSGQLGEIVVRGDTVMCGYLNDEEATSATVTGGWLHTGDVGYIDAEGFLFLVDRIKEMIIRGGVNVYPKEIEHVIASHPGVDAVAVIPQSHEKYGQVAKACVVAKRGQELGEEEMRRFCQERMAAYKVPETFVFRARLPRNAIGKIVKKELIRELAEESTAQAVPVAHLFEGMLDRFIPEKAAGVDATVSYRITGGGGGDWTITIRDGKMTLDEGVVDSPRVYITAKDADYHDVATGKLDGITAVMTGRMSVEGDVGFMGELRTMLAPMEKPGG